MHQIIINLPKPLQKKLISGIDVYNAFFSDENLIV